jgi:hypothetical protein
VKKRTCLLIRYLLGSVLCFFAVRLLLFLSLSLFLERGAHTTPILFVFLHFPHRSRSHHTHIKTHTTTSLWCVFILSLLLASLFVPYGSEQECERERAADAPGVLSSQFSTAVPQHTHALATGIALVSARLLLPPISAHDGSSTASCRRTRTAVHRGSTDFAPRWSSSRLHHGRKPPARR